ncbi:hypothetical protein ASD37_04300 [Mycobacterium sp. Root135]|uniref:HNH endonuclease signature motif containing protein n=1 Tax=Mycobacterium sp. Root135 TaxID=1736457 RepID=UPI0006F98506|nr:HNH endonuclease signature motif containing protein [Mycobacterium sp. Root135]KQY09636.1 hypothetical protein ASD37_04300 [Mycobacterium sp. Root135]
MFDSLVTATTGASGATAVDAWTRVENAACARRLAAMLTILDRAYAASDSASRDQWCLDNWDAVIAEIGATQRTSKGTTEGFLLTALALRDRFPQVAAVFADGLITYAMARLIITRGALIRDAGALHTVDAAIATALRSGQAMSLHEAARTLDSLIAQHDPHAERRTRTKARDRSVDVVVDDASGLAQVFATLFAHDAHAFDAHAFDARIDALARTVCRDDPRTLDQRRADAIGALTHGNDRLACLCGAEDCPAAKNPPSTGVVVYVVAHADTVSPPATESDPAPAPDSPTDWADDAPELNEDTEPTETPTPATESEALDGEPPALFTKPLRELTLTESLTPAPGFFAGIRPAAMMGGQLLPGSIACRAAVGATLIPIVHPGLVPPEPHYRPSKKLAAFVRSRDQTCRFPGCHEPAANCDLDHSIPWPCGATQASNLKCLCRRHHLLKTFWGGENGWRDSQLDDGTIIWTAPDGRTHTTAPGSRLLFPELCAPTGPAVTAGTPAAHTAGLTMPRRKTTRAHDRARRIHAERTLNEEEAGL